MARSPHGLDKEVSLLNEANERFDRARTQARLAGSGMIVSTLIGVDAATGGGISKFLQDIGSLGSEVLSPTDYRPSRIALGAGVLATSVLLEFRSHLNRKMGTSLREMSEWVAIADREQTNFEQLHKITD